MKITVEEADNHFQSTSYWVFDAALARKFFKEEWSLDGGRGTRSAFFDNSKLVGIWEDEHEEDGGRYFTIAYDGIPGASYSKDTGDSRVFVEPADDAYLDSRQQEFIQRFDLLMERLKAGKVHTEGELVTVTLEQNQDLDGENVIYKVRVVLSRKAYHGFVE